MDPSRMSSQESVPSSSFNGSSSVSTWGTSTSPGSNTSSLSMRSLFGSLPKSETNSQWNQAPWNSEGEDKAGNLPAKDSLSLFGWKPRPRANSDGGSSHLSQRKQEITSWLNSQDASGSGSSWMAKGRIRRASSKDIEEAMTGGLNKADIFMPPM